MGSLKKEKRRFDRRNRQAAHLLRLFTKLHLEREEILEEISEHGVRNLEAHEKEAYHKRLKRNVKQDERVVKKVEEGTREGLRLIREFQNDFKHSRVDSGLQDHVGYLEKVLEKVQENLDFLKDRADHYRRNDGEFMLLLETMAGPSGDDEGRHKEERERFKELLSVIEPSKLSEAERLGERISESFKRAVYPVGGAAVGGWVGNTLASVGFLDTGGQIQATPEQVRNAQMVGAFMVGVTGLCYRLAF